MGYPTPIEWTDATWNPIGGCSPISPGCVPCYAMRLAGTRLKHHPLYEGTTKATKAGPVFNGHMTAAPLGAAVWDRPLTWRGAAAPKLGEGQPSLIFVGDMADLFHEARALEPIDHVIWTAAKLGQRKEPRRRHILQLLTKRADRMQDYWHGILMGRLVAGVLRLGAVPENIWLGVSAEDQRCADERRPALKALAAAGFPTFVSYEPALGPVDWSGWEFVRQIISGGCSGPDAWPSHPDWHRATRDFCAANGIAYFFKQWGAWAPTPTRVLVHRGSGRPEVAWPDGTIAHGEPKDHGGEGIKLARLSKAAAGAEIDGREHREFPRPSAA